MEQLVKQSSEFIQSKTSIKPKVGIVLGSGLSQLSAKLKIQTEIPYKDIPNFPVSTVQGHSSTLLLGTIGATEVLMMNGRFHYYEGYDMKEVTFPIRVMKQLEINVLILSNASGGMNPDYHVGDIILLKDHINLFPENPLRGANIDAWGDRFPDMSEPYSLRLRHKVLEIAKENRISIQEGVYVGTSGPTFETPAEYAYFRRIGGDCVGMSTVPETIVARHSKMEVVAFSVITDLGIEGMVEKVSHKEVLQAANSAEPILSELILRLIDEI